MRAPRRDGARLAHALDAPDQRPGGLHPPMDAVYPLGDAVAVTRAATPETLEVLVDAQV